MSLTSKIKDEPIPYFLQYSQRKIGGFRRHIDSSLDSHIDENTKRKRSVTIAENTKNKNIANSLTIEQNTSKSHKALEKPDLNGNVFKVVENELESEAINNKIQADADNFDITQKLKM